jgi:hypothetical protein
MLGLGWLTIRQAQEALDNGRLEEAHRLLCQPEVQGHKGASPLLRQIAKNLVDRGEQHLRHDDPAAAWNDLRLAEKIAGSERGVARLRQALTKLGLEETHKLLDAGEPARALETLSQLQHGAVRQADSQLLEELAKGWLLARDLAGRGEFAMALETVDRIRLLAARAPVALERFRTDLSDRRPAFVALLVQLHEAMDTKRWRLVVSLSDQVLALAPQHGEARKARGQAWRAIEPAPLPSPGPPEETPRSPRFLLWIDGAGGYLVCLGARITIGQAAPDVAVDVPVLADIARTHVALTRDTEGYFLEAVRSVLVNGERSDKALLHPGDRITLGACCQLQFRQPVPVSATARLDVVSGHRLPLAVDGVLLMADTLVLGPSTQAHVTIPDIRQPVILFRQKEGLGVRFVGNLVVDGQPCRERATLGPNSRVQGDDFAFAVEPIPGAEAKGQGLGIWQ